MNARLLVSLLLVFSCTASAPPVLRRGPDPADPDAAESAARASTVLAPEREAIPPLEETDAGMPAHQHHQHGARDGGAQ